MWFEGMEDLDRRDTKVDFIIHMKPYEISLECPHCNTDIYVSWDEVNAPESWSDDWGSINCPCCGKEVSLGNREVL